VLLAEAREFADAAFFLGTEVEPDVIPEILQCERGGEVKDGGAVAGDGPRGERVLSCLAQRSASATAGDAKDASGAAGTSQAAKTNGNPVSSHHAVPRSSSSEWVPRAARAGSPMTSCAVPGSLRSTRPAPTARTESRNSTC